MKRYQPETPRTLLALMAAAMTAITIGVFVVLPATETLSASADSTVAKAAASQDAGV